MMKKRGIKKEDNFIEDFIGDNRVHHPEMFNGEVGDTLVYYGSKIGTTITKVEHQSDGNIMYHLSDGGSTSTNRNGGMFYIKKSDDNKL